MYVVQDDVWHWHCDVEFTALEMTVIRTCLHEIIHHYSYMHCLIRTYVHTSCINCPTVAIFRNMTLYEIFGTCYLYENEYALAQPTLYMYGFPHEITTHALVTHFSHESSLY